MTRDSTPRPVGEGLDALARRLGAPTASSMGAVFTRWPDAVGELVAAHTRPLSLHDRVLVVGVDDPVWATELRFRTDDMIAKIAAAAGPGVVDRIELRVVGPNEPSKPPPRGRR